MAAMLLAGILGAPAQGVAVQDTTRSSAPVRLGVAFAERPAVARSNVTLSIDDVSLDAALMEIARLSGVPIMYGEDVFRSEHVVTLRLRNASFTRALDRALRGTDFIATAAPGGRGVMVQRVPSVRQQAAADTLVGRALEAGTDGRAVEGAEVVVDGRRVAVTDRAGRFILVLDPGSYEVMVTKIGFAPVTRMITVPLTDPDALLFEMTVQPLALTELVVTGVADPIEGVKLPFTVGRVAGEDITAVPAQGSALAAVQGKIAGVSMVRSSGQPGQEPEILLRTPTSIQDSNAPMIIVDGVVLASTYVTPSVDIDALDIESIEVVKGAAAASLYGSRAANGVIQIRTRRGGDLAAGETRIRARSEIGVSSAPTDLPLANHHFYVTNEQGQFLDSGGNVTTDPAQRVIDSDRIQDNAYGVPLYDNVGTFYRPGRFMTNSVTLSQNHSATNFSLSIGNSEERGSLENNDGFRNRNARLNLDHRIGDRFTVGGGVYHARTERDLITGSPYLTLLSYSPEVDIGRRGEDGEFLQQPDPTVSVENPIWTQSSRDDVENRIRTLGNIQGRLAATNWLTFTGLLSYDRTELNTRRYTPLGTPLSVTTDNPSNGSLQLIRQAVDAINGSVNANLLGSFGDLTARLNLTAFMEREDNDFMVSAGTNFLVPDVPSLSVATNRTSSSSLTQIRSDGYLAQTGLDYAGRYIADVLVRRDGSSLFGSGNQWHTYYRGAFAWRMSEEPWFEIPGITDFKLRFARGTAGGRPAFADRFETWFVSSTTGAVSRTALGNRDLRPSKTTEQEFGIDVIAQNRYSLQLSYIDQTTEGQLIAVPVPSATGFTTQVRNAGTMSGTTWEATFEARVMERPDFQWSTTLISDRSRSRIDDLQRSCYISLLTHYCGGQSMTDVWGRRFLSGPGDLPAVHANSADEFQVNDDGYLVPVGAGNSWRDGLSQDLWGTTVTIDGINYAWGLPVVLTDTMGLAVVERIGTNVPDFNLGWLNRVTWRGFSLHTHMHAQVGGEVYNNLRQRLYNVRRHGDVDQSGKADELKKPDQYYTRLYNANAISEPFLEDASYLKLRELAVKYDLTQAQLSRIGLGNLGPQRISVGIIGRNLLTLTNYTGFDPEVGSILSRYDSGSYPNTRTFTGTIEITF